MANMIRSGRGVYGFRIGMGWGEVELEDIRWIQLNKSSKSNSFSYAYVYI